jgi:threonine/homoserine/homoserine lactone efflux protein
LSEADFARIRPGPGTTLRRPATESDMADLGVFVALLAVAYLVPGPDMVLILQTGAAQGRGPARAAALGLALARGLHVALSALGLAALLVASPAVFDALRLAGAAYLVWLGWRIWRGGVGIGEPGSAAPPWSRAAAFRRGLLTNLANPKALLFCTVLLPHFVRSEPDAMAARFLLLGGVLVATGLLFDLAYAEAGAGLGRWLRRHPVARRVQGWIFAGLLAGFGIGLALRG